MGCELFLFCRLVFLVSFNGINRKLSSASLELVEVLIGEATTGVVITGLVVVVFVVFVAWIE